MILLEDEYLIALDAEDILKGLGAEQVEVVSSVAAARDAESHGHFDLALLDINVNGEMSYSLAEEFAGRNVSVIFASGYELREKPILNGAPVPCIGKPYSGETLQKAVAQALAPRARAH